MDRGSRHQWIRIFWWGKKCDRAHRIAYEIAKGKIPDGLHLCHHCDTPTCCNPSHMFVGTRSDNLRDMSRKGRWGNQFKGAIACAKGHEYNEKNTLFVNGKRYCRPCRKEAQRHYMKRLKEKNHARA